MRSDEKLQKISSHQTCKILFSVLCLPEHWAVHINVYGVELIEWPRLCLLRVLGLVLGRKKLINYQN